MTYRTTHTTSYTYVGTVVTCQNQLRLTPRRTEWQIVHESRVNVDPIPENVARFRDYFGNEVHHLSVLTPHNKLTIEATSVVELKYVLPPEPSWTVAWESAEQQIRTCADRPSMEAFEFTGESTHINWNSELARWASEIFEPGRPVLEAAIDLNSRIHTEFTYVPCSTTIETPLSDVFSTRRGVCQDFAHLMIAALRSLGLAARYVSGYLRSGAQYTGAEASHAWASLFVPAVGWIDLDPTNNVLPSDSHVTLAWGRDYSDVAPVKGIALGGGEHSVEVAVRVTPDQSGG